MKQLPNIAILKETSIGTVYYTEHISSAFEISLLINASTEANGHRQLVFKIMSDIPKNVLGTFKEVEYVNSLRDASNIELLNYFSK